MVSKTDFVHKPKFNIQLVHYPYMSTLTGKARKIAARRERRAKAKAKAKPSALTPKNPENEWKSITATLQNPDNDAVTMALQKIENSKLPSDLSVEDKKVEEKKVEEEEHKPSVEDSDDDDNTFVRPEDGLDSDDEHDLGYDSYDDRDEGPPPIRNREWAAKELEYLQKATRKLDAKIAEYRHIEDFKVDTSPLKPLSEDYPSYYLQDAQIAYKRKKRKVARAKRTYNREQARYDAIPRNSKWCEKCKKIEEAVCDWCGCGYGGTNGGKYWTYNMKARVIVHAPEPEDYEPGYPRGKCYAIMARKYNLKEEDFWFEFKPSEGGNSCYC